MYKIQFPFISAGLACFLIPHCWAFYCGNSWKFGTIGEKWGTIFVRCGRLASPVVSLLSPLSPHPPPEDRYIPTFMSFVTAQNFLWFLFASSYFPFAQTVGVGFCLRSPKVFSNNIKICLQLIYLVTYAYVMLCLPIAVWDFPCQNVLNIYKNKA